jgi:hypothetical protein
MSSDADTRVVAAYKHTDTPTGTLANSYNVVKFTAMTQDTHAMYSASTGLWTIGVSGYYEIDSELELARTNFAAGDPHLCAVYVNGVAVAYGSVMSQGTVTRAFLKVNAIIKVNAGDTVGIYSYTNATGVTFSASYGASSVSLRKISGPAQIAASESISARYTNTAGTTMTNAADTQVPFATKDWDTHGIWSTDTMTAPVSGKYQITGAVNLSNFTPGGSQYGYVYIKKNGTAHQYGGITGWPAVASNYGFNFSFEISLLASETVTLFLWQNSGSNRTLSTTSGYNWIAIKKVGN